MNQTNTDRNETSAPLSNHDIGNGPDGTVIKNCNAAIALLEGVAAVNDRSVPYPGDDALWSDLQAPAWELTYAAMAADVTTLAGARAQVALLLWHHKCQGSGPEHEDIELPVLKNLLRLLPAN
jgi:hypothetical protein